MSAQPKVDVLAVMDRAFGAANEKYDDMRSEAGEPPLGKAYLRACRFMQEHREARAAVAELVEADREYDKALARRDALAGEWLSTEKQNAIQQRVNNAIVRRSAALARIGGAE